MEIFLSDKYKIHIYENIKYDKEEVIKEIFYNNDVVKKITSTSTELKPGIQGDILINTFNINEIKSKVHSFICKTFGVEENEPFYTETWSYMSKPEDIYTGYHTHTFNNNLYFNNTHTYVFYIQMPDFLDGDDGKIFFKTEDNIEHKILPKEGDLIIFPADLPHKPELSKKSKKERIVLAGNYIFLNFENSPKKKNKTLF